MDHLNPVKSMLGITGEDQDETLRGYIEEVKGYMVSGGVSSSIINSTKATGCIARGVIDLWNYGAGGSLSPYFMQRVSQLAMEVEEDV